MQLENLVVACFPATLNHDVLRQRPVPKAQQLSVRHGDGRSFFGRR